MWVIQDCAIQFVMGIVLCAIFFGIWKATHKGEKL